MRRPKPLCAWCGLPLKGANLIMEWVDLPGKPEAGWHLQTSEPDMTTCLLADPARGKITMEDFTEDDATGLVLQIDARGPGRVVRRAGKRVTK